MTVLLALPILLLSQDILEFHDPPAPDVEIYTSETRCGATIFHVIFA